MGKDTLHDLMDALMGIICIIAIIYGLFLIAGLQP